MTIKEFLKELKKEAKKNDILEMEIEGTCLREGSFLFWVKDDSKPHDQCCYKLGYFSSSGGNVVKPFIGKF